MFLNAFEWFLIGFALLLIAALMNMFPLCKWLASKTLRHKAESPSKTQND